MKTCSIENCNSEKLYLKGMCCKHYQQMRLYGKVYRSAEDPNEVEFHSDHAHISLYDKQGVEIAKAKIDLEDVERVITYKWYFHERYAANTALGRLHHFIMNDKSQYDHINTNTLDNRKDNLRLSTQTQNCRNRNKPSNNTSGAKGVIWSKRHNYYITNIGVDYKTVLVGNYTCLIEAAEAYNKAAHEIFKEFALPNDHESLKERIANGEIENKGDGRTLKQYKLKDGGKGLYRELK